MTSLKNSQKLIDDAIASIKAGDKSALKKFGAARAIPPVDELTEGAVFENAVRRIGVTSACEWFGYQDGDFVKETVLCLLERSKTPWLANT